MNNSFVYDGTEVRLTGRTASKTGARSNSVITVVEITPVEEQEGGWKKWVPRNELYEITDPNK